MSDWILTRPPERAKAQGMLVWIKTFGCQMNVYDSERMLEILGRAGWESTDDMKAADLLIYNSCSIREKAEDKLVGALGRGVIAKRNRPGTLLAVTGCTAQLAADTLLKRLPEIDLIIGPDRYADLLQLVARAEVAPVVAIEQDDHENHAFLQAAPTGPATRVTAFVTIMKGCDNWCAYCIVPAARGHEYSRDATEVLEEIRRLTDSGVREVFLIGQNVNSYRGLSGGFPALLERVAEVEGVRRIRFTTSHPKDLDRALVRAMADVPAVCQWLHLPVQAGDSRVLQSMNRGYTREHYLEKVALVRELVPTMGLTTDIIVGFPGETPAEFERTMSLLESVRYDSIFSFRFSPRPGTRAAKMEDNVPLEEKQERLARVQALQARITQERLASFVGQTHEVLVEGSSRHGGGQLMGRIPEHQAVNFMGDLGEHPAGSLAKVAITGAGSHTLEGRLAEQQ